jgi:hypothetical protein
MKSLRIFTVAFVLVLAGCQSNPSKTDAGNAPPACRAITEKEVASLFDRWNTSLQTGDPKKVVANYAPRSILLPTVSNKPRVTPEEKIDYFETFLKKEPFGKIDMHFIEIGCNRVLDAGLYTFTFKKTGEVVPARYTYTYAWDGKEWLITSHHSSAMPEQKPEK